MLITLKKKFLEVHPCVPPGDSTSVSGIFLSWIRHSIPFS